MPADIKNESIHFEVACLYSGGFAVVKIDLTKPREDGVEAIVMSTHHDREEAQSAAARLSGQLH